MPERETMRDQKKRIKHAKKMRRTVLLFVVLILLGGCTRKEELLFLDEGTGFEETLSEDEGDIEDTASEEKTEQVEAPFSKPEEEGLIYVHVCGAVASPGVYELKAGSRVYEAVQKAGGFTGQAEQNYINQAQVLTDGVKLVIPTVEEAAADQERASVTAVQDKAGASMQVGIVTGEPSGQTDEENSVNSGDSRININTASEEQLCAIPGVGATRAAAIAAYRDAHGSFKRPEDIMQVSGIKEGMFEKIKDSICVN